MKLHEAVSKAMNDIKVMNLEGYFLASIFSITEENKDITEWTILFYNPKTGKTRDCFVNEKFVTLEEETPAQKDFKEVNLESLIVKVNDAIEIAQKHFAKKSISILITLHYTDRLYWTITMIGNDITATSYEIDAKTGKITKEETVNLVKRL